MELGMPCPPIQALQLIHQHGSFNLVDGHRQRKWVRFSPTGQWAHYRQTADGASWAIQSSRFHRIRNRSTSLTLLKNKLRDLRNRLGFTLSVAQRLAAVSNRPESVRQLAVQEQPLRNSRLAKEDTYCNDRMTTSERRWLEANRPPEAAAWHVLSDLMPEYVSYA